MTGPHLYRYVSNLGPPDGSKPQQQAGPGGGAELPAPLEQWMLDDNARVELPVIEADSGDLDTYPVGVAFDLTSSRQIQLSTPLHPNYFDPVKLATMLSSAFGLGRLVHVEYTNT